MNPLLDVVGEVGHSLPPALMLASIVAIFSAAVLQGFTGFGFSLAAVPLLSLVMLPTKAVPIAIVMLFLSTAIEFRHSSKVCHWPSLRWLMVGAAIGSPLGTLALALTPTPAARLIISAIICLAVVVLGRGLTLARIPARTGTCFAGFFSGVFNGIAAMPGPPAVAYYLSVPLTRAAARASLLVFFLMTSVAATVTSAAAGLITLETVGLSLLGLPVMWIGTRIGRYFFARGSETLHRNVSIASLAAVALASAIKGVSELT